MKENTIFVSIASYCDSMLLSTVQNCIQKAKHPERLRFGIVEQELIDKRIKLTEEENKLTRYLGVNPIESRGTCWARSVAMSMYCDEDWFFQIDSHMLFDQDWDEWFINKIILCKKFSHKPIISGYPNEFNLVNGNPIIKKENGLKVNVLHKNVKIEDFNINNFQLSFEAKTICTKNSVFGFHVGGGCLFASGKFVQEVPYDPQLYFTGEEQAIALRSYTHGWDILHVPDMPIYHLWDRSTRLSHWDTEVDINRSDRWWILAEQAKKRLANLVTGGDLGIFSIGKSRSLQDYAKFCGIDYTTSTISEKAFLGPWFQVLE